MLSPSLPKSSSDVYSYALDNEGDNDDDEGDARCRRGDLFDELARVRGCDSDSDHDRDVVRVDEVSERDARSSEYVSLLLALRLTVFVSVLSLLLQLLLLLLQLLL